MFLDDEDKAGWIEWYESLVEDGFADQFDSDDEAVDSAAAYIAHVEGMDFEDARAFLYLIHEEVHS